MLRNIKKIISAIYLIVKTFRNYKGRFLVMLLLGFLGGLFSSVGISAAIPLFGIVTGQSNSSDFITKSIQTLFRILYLPFSVPFLLAFLIVIFVLKAVLVFIAKYYNDVTTATYEEQTRKLLLADTLGAGWLNLAKHKVGYVDRVILYDVQQTADALNQISTSIFTITALIAYTFVALKISATITLITLTFGAVLFFIFKPLYYRTRKLAETIGLTFKLAGHNINESIIGAKTIKIAGIENEMIRVGKNYFNQLKLSKIKTALYGYLIGIATEPIAIIFIAALFLMLYRQPSFNIIVFGVTMYIVQKMFAFIQTLQGQAQNINQAIPYIKVVNNYSEETKAAREVNKGNKNFQFIQNLEFRNVSFCYNEQKLNQALFNINFQISRGETVGIMGPSGSGKTTIVDLILRLLEPTAGEINIDGVNIQKINLDSWRKNIGYVPQDVFLLNDTVENNIRFYDNSITEEALIRATKMANIYDTIQGLPEQFNAVVGERGVNLSGGQRQRITLARALARQPRILILDEATSAVDVESEKLIQESVQRLSGEITILIIAHRPPTAIRYDKIIVIKNGRLIEQGPPLELLKNQGSYFYKMRHIGK